MRSQGERASGGRGSRRADADRRKPTLPKWKIATAVLLSVLPSWLKLPLYRWCCGYAIGAGVRIGFGTLLVALGKCRFEEDVRIGAFNLFASIDDLSIGAHTQIGHFNVFRGGDAVSLGPYVTILRGNVFNAGQLSDFITPRRPVLELGMGTFVATGHWVDFTDRVSFGAECILGGRGSSLWTHNRQRTRPIRFGPQCYLGSDIRVAPGVVVAPQCIVSLGAVLIGRFLEPRTIIAGNPGAASRTVSDHDLYHVTRKTRDDIPDRLHAEISRNEMVSPSEQPSPAAM